MHQSRLRYDQPIVLSTRESVKYKNRLDGLVVEDPREAMYRNVRKKADEATKKPTRQGFVVKHIKKEEPPKPICYTPTEEDLKPHPKPLSDVISETTLKSNCLVDEVVAINVAEAAEFLGVSIHEIIETIFSGGGKVGQTGHTVHLKK